MPHTRSFAGGMQLFSADTSAGGDITLRLRALTKQKKQKCTRDDNQIGAAEKRGPNSTGGQPSNNELGRIGQLCLGTILGRVEVELFNSSIEFGFANFIDHAKAYCR